jgi:hypothetical protein
MHIYGSDIYSTLIGLVLVGYMERLQGKDNYIPSLFCL